MKFTYEPNFRDSFRGVLFGFWGTPIRALWTALFCLFFGAMLAIFFWSQTPIPPIWIVTIAIIASLLWGAVFTVLFGACMGSLATKRQRAFASVQTIVVSDAGLERTAGSSSHKVDWSGVSRVEERRIGFVLYNDSGPVFSIERSAIVSEKDLRDLRRFLRDRKPGKYNDDIEQSAR